MNKRDILAEEVLAEARAMLAAPDGGVVRCRDGFTVSIMGARPDAPGLGYACDWDEGLGRYTTVEIYCVIDPNDEDLLGECFEFPERREKEVTGHLGVEVVSKLLARHGGVRPEDVKLLPPGVTDWS